MAPTPLTIPLDDGRQALLGALDAFEAAARSLDDLALLAPSRCHGWARLDCIVHVRVGLEEMLAGMRAVVDAPPTVDAASYWSMWQDAAAEDPVPGILWTRRTASAYSRPRGALEQLGTVVAGVADAAGRLGEGSLAFQGHVISAGDLLATWAVELVIHHLDLDLPAGAPAADPAALALARRTVEALGTAGPAAPTSAEEIVLTGFGRR